MLKESSLPSQQLLDPKPNVLLAVLLAWAPVPVPFSAQVKDKAQVKVQVKVKVKDREIGHKEV